MTPPEAHERPLVGVHTILPLAAATIVLLMCGAAILQIADRVSASRNDERAAARIELDQLSRQADIFTATLESELRDLALAITSSLEAGAPLAAASAQAVDQLPADNKVLPALNGFALRSPEGIELVDAEGAAVGAENQLAADLYSPASLAVLSAADSEALTFSASGRGVAGAHFRSIRATERWLSIGLVREAMFDAVDNPAFAISLDSATPQSPAGRIDAPNNRSSVQRGRFLSTDVSRSLTVTSPRSQTSLLPLFAAMGLSALLTLFAFEASRFAVRRWPATRDSSTDALAVVFDNTIIGMAELDGAGIVMMANAGFSSQAGLGTEEIQGHTLLSIVHPDDRSRHLSAIDRAASTEHPARGEFRYQRPDGTAIWVDQHISRVGNDERLLVQTQDITYRRETVRQLAHEALTDSLTGLPNRKQLLPRLKNAINASQQSAELMGVMFIDIDRFKVVNDSLGHAVGDGMIVAISQRIKTAVRDDDSLSRFGGDEFVVLLPRLGSLSEANAIADRIRRATKEPITVGEHLLHGSVSIGLATTRGRDCTADELLRDADAAMFRAKERGRNRVEVFDRNMRERLDERVELEADLRSALDNNGLTLWYQSIVHAPTGQPAGFESLVRWHHPTRGLLLPGRFLPTAEEAGLTGTIDRVGLGNACRQLAEWSSRYPAARQLYVSSNIVPRQFKSFIRQIEDTLERTGLPPNQLLVEVVENALLDDAEGALSGIQALRSMGVQIAIDDFGTGYSSLSYLTQFKPDKLKIDRSFVMNLPDDRAALAIVQAIATMSEALDIAVIAEGVETVEQANILLELGVPFVQGYLYAKPRPAEQIEAWLAGGRSADPLLPEISQSLIV